MVLGRILLLLGTVINAAPFTLQTIISGVNAGHGVLFDLTNIRSSPVLMERFYVLMNGLPESHHITIYTRPGTYIGYTTSASLWTQIHSENVTSAGPSTVTQLSVLQNKVEILSGSTQSFYFQVPNPGSFIYSDGSVEGQLFASDSNIEFYEGAGMEDFGMNLVAPRIFNGVIFYSIPPSLQTTLNGFNAGHGVLFDLKNIAATSIFIKRFYILMNGQGQTHDITVYTRPNTYIGYTNDANAWTQIHFETVTSAGPALVTQLSQLQNRVKMLSGSTQAFYIQVPSPGSFVYSSGSSEGALFTSDSSLEFYEGAGMEDFGTGWVAPRVFNGVIFYSIAAPTTSPTISPTSMPSNPSIAPTNPTKMPSNHPTSDPTNIPTINPTFYPTTNPSSNPTVYPTVNPTLLPSNNPTKSTVNPTLSPTFYPTQTPTYFEGGINDGKTTQALNQNTENAENSISSSNALENMFGPLWYVTVILFIVVLIFCLIGVVLLWKKRKSKQMIFLNYVEDDKKSEPHEPATNLNVMQTRPNTTAVELITTKPLPAEQTDNVQERDGPKIFVTPIGPDDSDSSQNGERLTPITTNNGVDDTQTCDQCGVKTNGKMDTDGKFICNQCWTDLFNDDDEEMNELYDKTNKTPRDKTDQTPL